MNFIDCYPQILLPPQGPQSFLAPIPARDQHLSNHSTQQQLPSPTWANRVTAIAHLGLAAMAGLQRGVRRQTVKQPVDRLPARSPQQQPWSVEQFPAGSTHHGPFDRRFGCDAQAYLRHIRFCKMQLSLSHLAPIPYSPDLLIYTDRNFLIEVEIDEPWHWSSDHRQRLPAHDPQVDADRNAQFLQWGIVVIRFSERQIVEQTRACLDLIQSAIDTLPRTGQRSALFYRQLFWRSPFEPLYNHANCCLQARPRSGDYRRIQAPRSRRPVQPQQQPSCSTFLES